VKSILSLLLALLVCPAVANAQAPPERRDYKHFLSRAAGTIPTPGASAYRLFIDSGTLKMKNPDGSTSTVAASLSTITSLDELSDVVLTAPAGAQFMRFNGTNWVNAAIVIGDLPSTAATDAEVAAAYQPLNATLTALLGLVDPNADRILFWDDSAGGYRYLEVGSGLQIVGTTLSATGGGGATALNDLTDVDTTGLINNSILKYNGTTWVIGTDNTGSGTFDPATTYEWTASQDYDQAGDYAPFTFYRNNVDKGHLWVESTGLELGAASGGDLALYSNDGLGATFTLFDDGTISFNDQLQAPNGDVTAPSFSFGTTNGFFFEDGGVKVAVGAEESIWFRQPGTDLTAPLTAVYHPNQVGTTSSAIASRANLADSGGTAHFNLSSAITNSGSDYVVGVFGYGKTTGQNGVSWGGNFVGYTDVDNDLHAAYAVGQEINFGALGLGDLQNAVGTNLAAIATADTPAGTNKSYIQLNVSGGLTEGFNAAPTYGIDFIPVDSQDANPDFDYMPFTSTGIKMTGVTGAMRGIDFAGSDFSGGAINLPNELGGNTNGIYGNANDNLSAFSLLYVTDGDKIIVGDTGVGGLVVYSGSTDAFEFTPTGAFDFPEMAAAPGTPTDGFLYYNTTDDTFYGRMNGAWVVLGGGGGASAFDDLSDVIITAAASGEYVRYNGTNWVDSAIQAGDIPDLSATYQPTDAELTALAGLSASGIIVRTGAGTATTRSLAAGDGIAISNTDGVSGNPSIGLATLNTEAHVRDDFMGGTGQSGTGAGQLGWTTANGNVAAQDGELGRPGIMRMSTTATISTHCVMSLKAVMVFDPDDTFSETFWFRPNHDDGNTQIRVGLAVSAVNPSTSGIYLEKLVGDTNWFFVTRAGGTETRTATGVDVPTTWTRVTIRRVNGTTVGVTIDGGSEVTATANITGATVYPFFSVFNDAASAKTLDVDAFELRITGLNR
jgi:hypothetical protein